MPTAIRDVVGWPDEIAPAEAGRPLNAGEEEIVIPLPLWAQMGRGRISATDAILASPFAPEGFAPSLGAYRLVLPFGGQQIDLTGAARASVQLAGPTAVELVASPGGRVMAQSQGTQRNRPLSKEEKRCRLGAPITGPWLRNSACTRPKVSINLLRSSAIISVPLRGGPIRCCRRPNFLSSRSAPAP